MDVLFPTRWGRPAHAALVVALAMCSGSTLPANAAQYYVDVSNPNRSDAGPGSAAVPWATLQHAADAVHAGDKVSVLPGNYTGFYLDASGTAALPIEFDAQPGVLITQRNATTPDGINLEGASHVVIDGFAVTAMPRAGVRAAAEPEVGMNHVTIRNVHAYDNQRWGIFTGFVDDLLIEHNETSGSIQEHGIYVSNSGDRPTLRGNVSWGNHGSGIHMNGDISQGGDGLISGALITGNVIYGNAKTVNGVLGGGSGINMDGVQDSRIENNVVWNNHASGISLYDIDGAEGSKDNVVVNNTVYQPSDGRWAINIRDASTGNAVRNNVLVTDHAFRGAISVWDDSLAGYSSDYNVLTSRFTTDDGDTVQTLAQWQAATGNDAHSKVATPAALFVSAATGDLRLKAGSPAIDAGSPTQAPAADILGAARPQGAGFDAGAYEFAAGLAGDFDGNGVVNSVDLAVWRAGFLAGTRTAAEFLVWQRALGGGAAASVPEPVGSVIVVLGLCAAAAVGRRSPSRFALDAR